jgi:hypothetical protein
MSHWPTHWPTHWQQPHYSHGIYGPLYLRAIKIENPAPHTVQFLRDCEVYFKREITIKEMERRFDAWLFAELDFEKNKI